MDERAIEYEYEFLAFAINDGSSDYYLRLSRLIPDLNVVQLKRMEKNVAGRKVIELGVRTDTIDMPYFMREADKLNLAIELEMIEE